jgi:uncharacterized membrane protein
MITKSSKRIESIDLLRGIVMVIMALDHVRDFFHYDALFFDPTDLTQTNTALFFTRFITHYCAPVFMFLAGTSAFFVGQRCSKKELSTWLLKRGVWLIIVELTIIKLGWYFNLDFSEVALMVIWALGASMLFLAAFIHVPKKLMITISVIVIFTHNSLDSFLPATLSDLWTLLHVQGPISTNFNTIFVAYPLIPWIFVMPLGYYFGLFYQKDFNAETRKKCLLYLGVGLMATFVVLRFVNVYGDNNLWSNKESGIFTFLSFINVTKYPPSLLYLLITLGPSIILLAYSEKWKGKLHDALVTIGRVPMFFYIIHIYIIHLLATIAVMAFGLSPKLMILDTFVSDTEALQGYGFSLWIVYGVWILLVIGLYPVCKWYWNYKSNNRDKWWLSYL